MKTLNKAIDRLIQRSQISPLPAPTEPICPLCRDHPGYSASNWVGRDARATPCSCELGIEIRTKRRLTQYKRAGLTGHVHDTFETLRLDPTQHGAYDAARQLSAALKERQARQITVPPILVLCGPIGAGKSHIAAAVAHEALEAQRIVRFTPVSRFVRLASEHAGSIQHGVTSSGDFDDLCEAELLVLDDLGAEHANSFQGGILSSTILARIDERRPTIITTNLSLSQLEPRLVSRLLEIDAVTLAVVPTRKDKRRDHTLEEKTFQPAAYHLLAGESKPVICPYCDTRRCRSSCTVGLT